MRPLRLAALLLALAPAAHAENPVVRFTTPLGPFDVELCAEISGVCEAAVPNSVTNFLGYVDRGDYVGSVVHRTATMQSAGVVIVQGGGFRREAPDAIRPVPTQPAIANEFHQSNRRGTVAYARVGGQANSATSQWFVNVQDNLALDTIDGGFTVFGVVVEGLAVVEAIHALPFLNLDSVCIDPLFGPNPIPIAANFRRTPMPQAFIDSIAGATTCQDLPPMEAFADAMIETDVARVPEPGAAAAGLAAAATLAGLARRRAALRRE